MKLGFVGMGKMGGRMVERLLRGRHEVVGYDPLEAAVKEAQGKGAVPAGSLRQMVEHLERPRVVWIMVPSGTPTEETVRAVSALLEAGDVVVDGGNSFYKDSIKRAEDLKQGGISFLDAGTSGGIWGLEVGYCLMVGGDKKTFAAVEPVFATLAPKDGYAHVGPCGSGHFVKMVHNGIEYALLQGYAEGFELLKTKEEFGLDLEQIARLWNQGSVVRSWLLELAEHAFAKNPRLDGIRDFVEDSGEGRWTVAEAMEQAVSAPVITLSLLQRFRSRQEESFAAKLIAALRDEFGGHGVRKK
jgi:6-phosphogluconate dehydrogenase